MLCTINMAILTTLMESRAKDVAQSHHIEVDLRRALGQNNTIETIGNIEERVRR